MAAESVPAADILKPSEAVPGTGIPFLNLTYHVGEARLLTMKFACYHLPVSLPSRLPSAAGGMTYQWR